MKQICYIILFIILVGGCENEVPIHASGDPVPVVYGLLNPNNPFQYIRIGRSYLSSKDGNSSQAKTDSTVWNMPVEVYMEEWTDGYPSKIITFLPYDGIRKDSGYFPSDNLRIYRAQYKPKPNTKYYLYVHFPDTDRIASGWTIVPANPVIEDPKEVPGRKITLLPNQSYSLRWRPSENASLYQGEFTFYIREEKTNDWQIRSITIPTKLFVELNPQNIVSKSFNGRRVYEAFLNKLDIDEEITRHIVSVEYRFFTGAYELALYVMGQGGDHESFLGISEYSNINNGVGVFSCLLTNQVSNLELSNITLDSLAHQELTRDLGFVDHRGIRHK